MLRGGRQPARGRGRGGVATARKDSSSGLASTGSTGEGKAAARGKTGRRRPIADLTDGGGNSWSKPTDKPAQAAEAAAGQAPAAAVPLMQKETAGESLKVLPRRPLGSLTEAGAANRMVKPSKQAKPAAAANAVAQAFQTPPPAGRTPIAAGAREIVPPPATAAPPSRLFFLSSARQAQQQPPAVDEPLPWQASPAVHRPVELLPDADIAEEQRFPKRQRKAPGAWYQGGEFSWKDKSRGAGARLL